MDSDYVPELTPAAIALVYALVSGSWILLSDRIVDALVQDPSLQAWLQTVKGWVFVVGSALLIYSLVSVREAELERTTEQLQQALQQTSILHRLLRHNLRNVCGIIRGNLEYVATDGGSERVETIEASIDRLVEMSRKATALRNFTLEDSRRPYPHDMVTVVEDAVQSARTTHPDAEFHTNLPDSAWVQTYEQIDTAVGELLDNAVCHNEDGDTTVRVGVTYTSDGRVRLEVSDDGPGIPEMERELLTAGIEKPMHHSQGIGLWLVRTVVTESGGDLTIVDNEPQGSVVVITLPAADPRDGTTA
ncbi:sensor histidine kinase [Halorientalis litorea]|uniref:sensor histidine kinase n=1 Tax=Halorientalis litorea TaxID=2931977 RepID=UPI001FF4DDB5|nr:HAMP domain-containing sensor histidine kinase [Halorientalis litorea]